MTKEMTAQELLKGAWFWFVALFTVPAFAGWLGYFSHVLAAPHFDIEKTAMAWAAGFALVALLPWMIIAGVLLVWLLLGAGR